MEKTNITAQGGLLYIKGAPESLKEELRFWEVFPKTKDVTYRNKEGEVVSFKKRDGYSGKWVDLFSLSEDGSILVTHRGLFRRIERHLKALSMSFEYLDLSPLPSFHFRPEFVAGSYPEQVRVLFSILSELGTGQHGWLQNKGRFVPPSPGSGGALIESTMSTGKTYMIASIIRCFPDQQILVVTSKSSVIRRLKSGLDNLLVDGEDQGGVGIYYSQKKSPSRITVCSDKLIDDFDTSRVGVIIYDEVHNASAEQTSGKLLMFDRAVKIGLSGTIRSHKKLKFIESIFGPVVDTISDQEAEGVGMVCPVKIYTVSFKGTKGPDVSGLVDINLERRGITNNAMRNRMIREIVDAIPPDMQTIIFVRTIEHIENLVENFLPPGFVPYHGQLDSKLRETRERMIVSGEALRVVANDALSEGVNTTKVRVIIEAGWSTSDQTVSQRAGRNRRLDEGKNMGIIVTFCDDWEIPDANDGTSRENPLKRRASSRIMNYKNREWPVIKVTKPEQIDFSEINKKPDVIPIIDNSSGEGDSS